MVCLQLEKEKFNDKVSFFNHLKSKYNNVGYMIVIKDYMDNTSYVWYDDGSDMFRLGQQLIGLFDGNCTSVLTDVLDLSSDNIEFANDTIICASIEMLVSHLHFGHKDRID